MTTNSQTLTSLCFRPMELQITIVSAKNLKNVSTNVGGKLKPYVMFWINNPCFTESDDIGSILGEEQKDVRRYVTKSDNIGSTQPLWNQEYVIPLKTLDSILNLKIKHSKEKESSSSSSVKVVKSRVGFLRIPLKDLVDPDDSIRFRTFELEGCPGGEIVLRLSILQKRPVVIPISRLPDQPFSYYMQQQQQQQPLQIDEHATYSYHSPSYSCLIPNFHA